MVPYDRHAMVSREDEARAVIRVEVLEQRLGLPNEIIYYTNVVHVFLSYCHCLCLVNSALIHCRLTFECGR